jgi:hypothetical protein
VRLVSAGILAVDHQRQRNVLLGAQCRQQVEELKHKPDIMAPHESRLVVAQGREALPGNRHFTARRLIEPAEQVQQG